MEAKSPQFKENLKAFDVTWEDAPSFSEIKRIQNRIVIGENGCGKSRLLRALYATLHENGVEIFIEFGPQKVLAGLINKIVDNAIVYNIDKYDDITKVIEKLEAL